MKSKRKSASRAARRPAPSKVKISGLYPVGVATAAPGYSPGILAAGRRLIVVSGQGPRDLGADAETQVRQTFEAIAKVLAAAGGTLKNVVMLRVYFLHLERDLPAYRKVRLEYLSAPFPASTAVGVSALAVPGLEIEIEAVAVV